MEIWRFETSTDEGALRQQMLVGTCLNPFMIWKCRPTALQLFSHHSKYIMYYKRCGRKYWKSRIENAKGTATFFFESVTQYAREKFLIPKLGLTWRKRNTIQKYITFFAVDSEFHGQIAEDQRTTCQHLKSISKKDTYSCLNLIGILILWLGCLQNSIHLQ